MGTLDDLHATFAESSLDRLGTIVCCYGSHYYEEDSTALWAPVVGHEVLCSCSVDLR